MTFALNPESAATTAGDGPDLIGRAQAGDDAAFEELCRQHGDRLLGQALALSGGLAPAEDLVQETLLAAWRSLPRYNRRCRFFTWLCSILIHRHRNSLRKKWARPFSFLFASEAEEEAFVGKLADPSPPPGTELERGEQARRILRSLDRLPAKQREVVYLRFYAEDSLEGIAAALGCSVGTVKSRLFHGLERLRKMKSLLKENEP